MISIPMFVFVGLAFIIPPMDLLAYFYTFCFASLGLLLPHKWIRRTAVTIMIMLAWVIGAACYDYARDGYKPTFVPASGTRAVHKPQVK